MIKIQIRNSDDMKSIHITGHADYDEYGKDIVCASVSTIYQLMLMGLRTLAEQYPENIEIIDIN